MKLLKRAPLMLCIAALSACSSMESANKTDAGDKSAARPAGTAFLAKSIPQAIQMPKVDPAWLAHYEPRLREILKGSRFEVQTQNNLLVVTAPVDQSFNPDRPTMLMPAALGPISKIAKLVEDDRKTAVMVFGHSDDNAGRVLSQERAKSFAAIFRLSGLRPDRLQVKGMGDSMPRASGSAKESRTLNRRVEMVLAPQNNLNLLMAQYEAAYPSLVASAANPSVAPAAKAAVAPASNKAKAVAQAPAKKAKAVAKTAQKPAAKPAKPTQVAAVDTKKKP